SFPNKRGINPHTCLTTPDKSIECLPVISDFCVMLVLKTITLNLLYESRFIIHCQYITRCFLNQTKLKSCVFADVIQLTAYRQLLL
ncbi:MAG: hypothetical protein ACOCYO_10420, partial [Bacteroidota bacterium]